MSTGGRRRHIPPSRLDEVARELMAAMLACEEALDAFVIFHGSTLGRGPIRDRLMAARAHIRHARAIAIAAGVFKP